MSISSEITRITEAKADIVSALAEKGVTVSDSASISDMGDYIRSIETGGGDLDFDKIYPIGSIYTSVNSTSPADLFGGTWEQISGRFLIGTGAAEANTTDYWGTLGASDVNCPAGEMGGEAWHTMAENEMPSHYHDGITTDGLLNTHRMIYRNAAAPTSGNAAYWTVQSGVSLDTRGARTVPTGGGAKHNNMPPYLAVYMWKRTA